MDSWKCPKCETVNSGENCIICGETKPKVSTTPHISTSDVWKRPVKKDVPPPTKDFHKGLLILWSIVSMLGIMFPGIVALSKAIKINKTGSDIENEKYAKSCRTWCIVGNVLAVLAIIGSFTQSTTSTPSTAPSQTVKHTPVPTITEYVTMPTTTPMQTYTSRYYSNIDDLPDTCYDLDAMVKDWLAYPSINSSIFVIAQEVTIKVGERARLELVRTDSENEFITCQSVGYGTELNFDWAGSGSGKSGHSHIGYFTAEEPGVIFVNFYNSKGVNAHMVVYAEY